MGMMHHDFGKFRRNLESMSIESLRFEVDSLRNDVREMQYEGSEFLGRAEENLAIAESVLREKIG
ncbi:hypothetical protein MHK_003653 [Candidatus Magnetomorum sp. HK-1]|nr:hypothetical protein MHK_003653 [Candidatus Magnetomorum sp. HK-1]